MSRRRSKTAQKAKTASKPVPTSTNTHILNSQLHMKMSEICDSKQTRMKEDLLDHITKYQETVKRMDEIDSVLSEIDPNHLFLYEEGPIDYDGTFAVINQVSKCCRFTAANMTEAISIISELRYRRIHVAYSEIKPTVGAMTSVLRTKGAAAGTAVKSAVKSAKRKVQHPTIIHAKEKAEIARTCQLCLQRIGKPVTTIIRGESMTICTSCNKAYIATTPTPTSSAHDIIAAPDKSFAETGRIEHRLREYLMDQSFSVYLTSQDKALNSGGVGGSLKYRPDFMFAGADRTVIVECDEHQHVRGTYSCEMRRISDIYGEAGICGKPLFVIRFNPHDFQYRELASTKSRAKVEFPTFIDRCDALIWLLEYLFSANLYRGNSRRDGARKFPEIMLLYMYYSANNPLIGSDYPSALFQKFDEVGIWIREYG